MQISDFFGIYLISNQNFFFCLEKKKRKIQTNFIINALFFKTFTSKYINCVLEFVVWSSVVNFLFDENCIRFDITKNGKNETSIGNIFVIYSNTN